MYIPKTSHNLIQKEIAASLQIWNRAAVSLLDIRHSLLSSEEALLKYRLPANAFVYTSSGGAEVLLGDAAYCVERFGLFHAGKGTELTIRPKCDWLEYYMVLYKAGDPSFQKREYDKRLEQTNPFRQQYGFVPTNPLFFADQMKTMFECWKNPTPLNLLYGKADFYRFVCRVYEELANGNVQIFEPDVVCMAVQFMEENYHKDVAIQEMCSMLGISYSHFHRQFKRKTAKTPQEFLIHTRLNAAREYLETTGASIREIAERCGFPDESSFYRLFTKNEGVSPGKYREVSQLSLRDSTIAKEHTFPYNWEGQVRPNELKGKGAPYMRKQMRSNAVVAAALSLMLLLSACGTTQTSDNGADSTPSSAVTSQVTETQEVEPVEAETKIVSTVRGDIEIPTNPQRVVVMNYAFGDILALGVTPAAVNDYWAIAGSAVEESLKDIPRASEPEEIMSIEPDLILTAYEKDEDYEKLSKIAPTVSFGSAKETAQQSMEDRLASLSDILGVEESVKDKVLAEFNQKITDAKQKLADAGLNDKTFTLMTNSIEESSITVASYKGAQALHDVLGMRRSEKGQELYETGEWYAYVSLEVLPEYCGDYIIIYGDGVSNVFAGNGVYESMDAVKNGNVLLMNEYLSTFNDIISTSSQVDFFVENLVEMANKN